MSLENKPDFKQLNDRLIVQHSKGPFLGIKLPDDPARKPGMSATEAEPSTAEDIAERLHNEVFDGTDSEREEE